jgi:hypothetical protein
MYDFLRKKILHLILTSAHFVSILNFPLFYPFHAHTTIITLSIIIQLEPDVEANMRYPI